MISSESNSSEKEGRSSIPERTKNIIQQLILLKYECTSCLNIIRHDVAVWSCNECFGIFHLYCIKKWAKQDESGVGCSFRCPHCQVIQSSVSKYLCFCGKTRDPAYDPHITPHSCGQTCDKVRPFCPHPCPLQCHPGPCPPCSAIAGPNSCCCGASTYTWRCGNPDPHKTCDNICNKLLSCDLHNCQQKCHLGSCDPCSEKIQIACYCLSESRELNCGSLTFSCGKKCGKKLRCGIHECDMLCHSGSCPPCNRDPLIISTCPCGAVPLKEIRIQCIDPIPTCENICGRLLDCGRHSCQSKCHDGACTPCKYRSLSSCICGLTQCSVPCKEQDGFKCNKICKTKLSCGKHDCRIICCSSRKKTNDSIHQCNRICNKKLSCGHECLELCHRGLCPPCVHVIAERLTCRCGTEFLMPPQPCGTLPPKCTKLCTIIPSCNHPISKHYCHYGDCPPCMFPVKRMCVGGHTIVGNVPCSAKFASCSAKCGKLLSCGHECFRSCHPESCIDKVHPCLQICGKIHNECGHVCKAKCHPLKECPPCSETVERRCECGRYAQKIPCKKFLRFLKENHGRSLDLKCNADCLFEQRLQILANRANFSPLPAVKYSLFLWELSVKNTELVQTIEKELNKFVESDDNFKNLQAMSAEKRALVHSLCQYYHIHSESVDAEPNRSCIITKTVKTRKPFPMLTSAISEPEKHSPLIFIKEICEREENLSGRVIVVKGENVSERAVSRVLQEYIGEFVCETEEVLANNIKQIRVFFINQTKQQQAYFHLRQLGPPFEFFIPFVTKEQSFKSVNTPSSGLWRESAWSKRNNLDLN